jgi:hypothetical protein
MKCCRLRIVGVLLLAGCMVGPDYRPPPATPMPVAYQEAPVSDSPGHRAVAPPIGDKAASSAASTRTP